MPNGETFALVGFCSTFGTLNATLLAGAIGAGLGYLVGNMVISSNPEMTEQEKTTALFITTAGGAMVLAVPTYFKCKGVKVGIPITKR